MSIKIKKRSKLFAETIDRFKQESLSQFDLIESTIAGLNKRLSLLIRNLPDGKIPNGFKNELTNLTKSIMTLKEAQAKNFETLCKEYGWLKNKLSILDDERKNFKTLYELSSRLEKENDLENLLQLIIDSVTDVIDAEYGVINLIDEDGGDKLVVESSNKYNGSFLSEMKSKVLETAIDSGSSIVMNNLMLSNGNNEPKRKFGSVMCIPLKSDDDIFGTIYLGVYRKSFSSDETELLEELEEKISQAIQSNIKFSMLAESRQKMLHELRSRYDFSEVIGESSQMATVLSIVADIADSNTAILIEGESGTGKEVIARAIHKNSLRADKPFIPINCSAIPENLLESELFGYEKGAFTGAISRKPGKFEQANGGTILLDEIGELSLSLQVKLLRFLQSHEFEMLGSNEVYKSDVRIITATKRNLSGMVEAGEFRDDLYYRINVININIPSLRERPGDIVHLVDHFITLYAESNGKNITGISTDALTVMEKYGFPGNVRELENTVERAVVLCKNNIISIDDLPDKMRNLAENNNHNFPQNSHQLKLIKKQIMAESVDTLEKEFVLNALRKAGGNISEASRLTQMHRKQFQRLMKRHDLSVELVNNKIN